MKTPLEKILRKGHIAFFGGFGLLLLDLLLSGGGAVALPVLASLGIAGTAACFGGIIYAAVSLRCPHCGASLMPGGRMPMSVPAYCSSCGEKLNDVNNERE